MTNPVSNFDGAKILEVARYAIIAAVKNEPLDKNRLIYDQPFEALEGVFVTLHTKDGSLRGCIGTIEPILPNQPLGEIIAQMAISSALRDPRFPPVQEQELRFLNLEVSLLHSREKVNDLADLDPKKFGIIVSSGIRRGVLLPDIDGVDDIQQQLHIALQKAHIAPQEDFSVERFQVTKFHDSLC